MIGTFAAAPTRNQLTAKRPEIAANANQSSRARTERMRAYCSPGDDISHREPSVVRPEKRRFALSSIGARRSYKVEAPAAASRQPRGSGFSLGNLHSAICNVRVQY